MNNSEDVVVLLAKAKQDPQLKTLLQLCMDVHIPVFIPKETESSDGWRIRSNTEIEQACESSKGEAFVLLKQETFLAKSIEDIEAAILRYKEIIVRLDVIIKSLKTINLEQGRSLVIEVFGR